jgi:hypothetical protein
MRYLESGEFIRWLCSLLGVAVRHNGASFWRWFDQGLAGNANKPRAASLTSCDRQRLPFGPIP